MSARRRDMKKLLTMKHVPWSTAGREIKRRKRKRDPQTHQIPDDIVEEIMLKLPVTSLTRFQTVSKQWRSLTRSKGFGERYMARHKAKDPKLFSICDDLVNRSKNTLYSKTMTLDTTNMTTTAAASQEEDYAWSQKFKRFTGFLEISESCDGLVCIYDMPIRVKLMNPASGMSISLPLARIQRLHIEHPDPALQLVEADPSRAPVRFRTFTQFGFGKDTVTGRYKLVWLYNEYPASATTTSSTLCEVLDLEDKKWRFVDTLLDPHHVLNGQRPAFANGSLYWLTGDEEGCPTTQTKIIVFDMHTEVFQVIPTPPCVNVNACGDKIGVCNLDGRLCISELKGDCEQEFWWMVEDDQTWEKIFCVDLRSTSTWFGGITSIPLTPLVICKDSNKVVLSLTYQDNLVSFDLDPHSPVYHLCSPGYYGLAVPYCPSLLLC